VSRGEVRKSATQVWISAMVVVVIALYVRVTLAAARLATPTVSDEIYWLLNGQVLLGRDEAAPIHGRFFYPVGYGVVTAAADVVGGSISRAFHISLVINVVFAFLTAWCLFTIGRRIFYFSVPTAAVSAGVVSVMPGVAATTTLVWSESLVQLSFVLFILVMYQFLAQPTTSRAVILGVVAGFLPAVHGRFTLLLPIAVIILVVSVVKRFVSVRVTSIATITLLVCFAISRLSNSWLRDTFYPNASNRESGALRKIANPSWWDEILHLLTGHAWYVLASSFGIAAIGVYVIIRYARTVERWEQRVTLTLIAVSCSALLLTSAIALASASRADIHIYGRYVDAFAPLLMFLGIAGLLTFSVRSRVIWIIGALSIVVIAVLHVLLFAEDRSPPPGYGRHNVLGLELVRDITDARAIWPFAVLAFVFTVGLIVVSFLSKKLSVLLVALLLAWGTSTAIDTIRPGMVEMKDLEIPHLLNDIGNKSVIGFDTRPDDGDLYRFSHTFARYRFMVHPLQIRHFNMVNNGIPNDINCIIGFVDREPPVMNGEQWIFAASDELYYRVLWQRPDTDRC
jgi:hypothetical protein